MRAGDVNTTALAFLGDAVYETYIRRHVMEQGPSAADKLHRRAVRYVRAEAQAMVIKKIFDSLDPEEQKLVKRARNHRSVSRPRHADPVDYRWATAFEALLGYWHLMDREDRVREIVRQAIELVEEERQA